MKAVPKIGDADNVSVSNCGFFNEGAFIDRPQCGPSLPPSLHRRFVNKEKRSKIKFLKISGKALLYNEVREPMVRDAMRPIRSHLNRIRSAFNLARSMIKSERQNSTIYKTCNAVLNKYVRSFYSHGVTRRSLTAGHRPFDLLLRKTGKAAVLFLERLKSVIDTYKTFSSTKSNRSLSSDMSMRVPPGGVFAYNPNRANLA